MGKGLKVAAHPALGPPDAFCDGTQLSGVWRADGEDAVGFPQGHLLEDNAVGLEYPEPGGHGQKS